VVINEFAGIVEFSLEPLGRLTARPIDIKLAVISYTAQRKLTE